jgi:hypothetical protein
MGSIGVLRSDTQTGSRREASDARCRRMGDWAVMAGREMYTDSIKFTTLGNHLIDIEPFINGNSLSVLAINYISVMKI